MIRRPSSQGRDLLESLEGTCPYPGLYSFSEADSPYFFGREQLTARVLERLHQAAGSERRLLSIRGPSGVGKSSLLQAGVLDAMRRNQLAMGDWPVLYLRPGDDPVASLAAAMHEEFGGDDLAEQLRSDQRTLHFAVQAALKDGPPSRHAVVVVDACEDLATLCRDGWRRFAFVNNLAFAGGIAGGRTIVVLVTRDDAVRALGNEPRLAIAFDDSLAVGSLSDDELREAIEMPARIARCRLEPWLLADLVADFKSSGKSLGRLQFVLRELWRKRDGWQMTRANYEQLGRLAQAIPQAADRFVAALPQAERDVVRRVFLRLVQPGDGLADTGRSIARRELTGIGPQPHRVSELVAGLCDARLLRADGDRLELAHKSLQSLWPTLAQWIDADRDSLRIHRRLTQAANRWRERDRDAKQLFRGAALLLADDWLDSHGDDANACERDFLAASRARDTLRGDAARGEFFRLQSESLQQNLTAAIRAKHAAERLAQELQTRAVSSEAAAWRAKLSSAEAVGHATQARHEMNVTHNCVHELERRVVSLDQDRDLLTQVISARLSECARLEKQLAELKRQRPAPAPAPEPVAAPLPPPPLPPVNDATLLAERDLISEALSAKLSEVHRLEKQLRAARAVKPVVVVAPASEPPAPVVLPSVNDSQLLAERDLISAALSARMTETSRLEKRIGELRAAQRAADRERQQSHAAELSRLATEVAQAKSRLTSSETSASRLQQLLDTATRSAMDAQAEYTMTLNKEREDLALERRQSEKRQRENLELAKSMFWSNSIAILAVVLAIVFLILWQSGSGGGSRRGKSRPGRSTTSAPDPEAVRKPTTAPGGRK